ncbi:MAG: hypothetical protein ACK5AY_08390, partial [Bacteroidota bacterium]
LAEKKVESQLARLNYILSETKEATISDRNQIEKILQELRDTQDALSVWNFFLAQDELASGSKLQSQLNQDVKVTADPEILTENITEKAEENITEKTTENTPENVEDIQTVENKISVIQSVDDVLATNEEAKSVHNAPEALNKSETIDLGNEQPKNIKKLELSLNDKFRIINELFNQNQQEFTIVIQQLNSVNNLKDAEIYINGLIELYKWDIEKPALKILIRIVNKRFL